MATWIIGSILLAALVLAARSVVRSMQSGQCSGCSGGCHGCGAQNGGGSCACDSLVSKRSRMQ